MWGLELVARTGHPGRECWARRRGWVTASFLQGWEEPRGTWNEGRRQGGDEKSWKPKRASGRELLAGGGWI